MTPVIVTVFEDDASLASAFIETLNRKMSESGLTGSTAESCPKDWLERAEDLTTETSKQLWLVDVKGKDLLESEKNRISQYITTYIADQSNDQEMKRLLKDATRTLSVEGVAGIPIAIIADKHEIPFFFFSNNTGNEPVRPIATLLHQHEHASSYNDINVDKFLLTHRYQNKAAAEREWNRLIQIIQQVSSGKSNTEIHPEPRPIEKKTYFWQKWGSIAGIIGLITAVLFYYLSSIKDPPAPRIDSTAFQILDPVGHDWLDFETTSTSKDCHCLRKVRLTCNLAQHTKANLCAMALWPDGTTETIATESNSDTVQAICYKPGIPPGTVGIVVFVPNPGMIVAKDCKDTITTLWKQNASGLQHLSGAWVKRDGVLKNYFSKAEGRVPSAADAFYGYIQTAIKNDRTLLDFHFVVYTVTAAPPHAATKP